MPINFGAAGQAPDISNLLGTIQGGSANLQNTLAQGQANFANAAQIRNAEAARQAQMQSQAIIDQKNQLDLENMQVIAGQQSALRDAAKSSPQDYMKVLNSIDPQAALSYQKEGLQVTRAILENKQLKQSIDAGDKDAITKQYLLKASLLGKAALAAEAEPTPELQQQVWKESIEVLGLKKLFPGTSDTYNPAQGRAAIKINADLDRMLENSPKLRDSLGIPASNNGIPDGIKIIEYIKVAKARGKEEDAAAAQKYMNNLNVQINKTIPIGYRPSVEGDPMSPLVPIDKHPENLIAPEEAAKIEMFRIAKMQMNNLEDRLFNKDGTINRKNILTAQEWSLFGVGSEYGLPWTAGREMGHAFQLGLQASNRAETGAAITPQEIQIKKATMFPSPADTDASIREKYKAYKSYILGVMARTKDKLSEGAKAELEKDLLPKAKSAEDLRKELGL